MSAVGQSNPFSDASEFNSLSFVIARAIDEMQTVSLVRVEAVNADAQTVDVLALTNLVTGANISVPHGVISARPYFRLQGGTNAIIIDPAVGDIGVMVFGSRDLTAVIAARGVANPGSQRKFSWSDGIYFGTVLSATAMQYVKIDSSGITIVTPNAVLIQAPTVTIEASTSVTITSPLTTIDGELIVTGNVEFDGIASGPGGGTVTFLADVVAAGTSVHTHEHPVVNVQTGGSTIDTGPPL